MKRCAVWLLSVVLVVVVALPVSGEEMIEVPCAEHARMTGQNLCDAFPVVKWKRSDWEAALRRQQQEGKMIDVWGSGDEPKPESASPQDVCEHDPASDLMICVAADGRTYRRAIQAWD